GRGGSVDELEVRDERQPGSGGYERSRQIEVDDRVLAFGDPADLAGEAQGMAAGVHREAALRGAQRSTGEDDEEVDVLHPGGGLEGGEQVGAADVGEIDFRRLHCVREHGPTAG